jgi:hypothetical protein
VKKQIIAFTSVENIVSQLRLYETLLRLARIRGSPAYPVRGFPGEQYFHRQLSLDGTLKLAIRPFLFNVWNMLWHRSPTKSTLTRSRLGEMTVK